MSHSQPNLTNEQAGQLFQEIAGIAETVDEHCYHLPVDLDESGALHAFIDQMRGPYNTSAGSQTKAPAAAERFRCAAVPRNGCSPRHSMT